MLEAGMCERLLTFVTGISGTGSNIKYEFTTYLIPDALSNKMVLDDTEYFWAGKMIEKMETMPGAKRTSTRNLWDKVSEEYQEEHDVIIHIPDLNELHYIFVSLAKARGYNIILEGSIYCECYDLDIRYVKLAKESDDYEVMEVKQKPRKCPYCGGEVSEIIYGATSIEKLCNESLGKQPVYGKDYKSENDPEWACLDCQQEFKKK